MGAENSGSNKKDIEKGRHPAVKSISAYYAGTLWGGRTHVPDLQSGY